MSQDFYDAVMMNNRILEVLRLIPAGKREEFIDEIEGKLKDDCWRGARQISGSPTEREVESVFVEYYVIKYGFGGGF